MGESVIDVGSTARPIRRTRRTGTTLSKLLFLGPAVIWILLFTLFPLIYAIRTSFYSFRRGKINHWVGLDNFRFLPHDPALKEALTTTLYYVVVVVVVEMLLGFLLALLFNRRMRGLGVLRTIMTLPLFASPIAIGFLGLTIFYEIDGPVNQLLDTIGIGGKPWLSNPTWARIAIMIIDVWQWTPFVFLVLLAGLQGLPQDVMEASELDGAGAIQRLFTVTIPLMAPTIWLVLLLRMIDAFKVVDIIVSMTQGGPGRATSLYGYYIFLTARRFFNYGGAAAQGILLLFIVSILVTLLWGRIRDLYETEK